MQKFKQGLELWGLNVRSNNGNAVTESNFLGTIIHANTANRTYTLPDKGGTIALLSDISAAVATHAALQTGVHGISVASGKTLTCSNTLTLAGTDSSTLNIGAGGTLGTGAFAATYSLPTATSSLLGGVKPDGTSILNTSGVLSATAASVGALANTTNDNATATTCYPVWVTAAGNNAAKIAASSLTFVPSTGVLGVTTIQATGDITAYYSSDRRLKRNIKPIDNPLEKLKQIHGVSFDWSEEYLNQRGGEDNYFVRKHDIGFIAQEVQAVLPEVVGERRDHFLGLKYDRITVLLAEAVKAQQVQIEAQQAQIERLLAALGMK